jgi:F420-non-reducing hydrogenase large subunit
MPEPVHKDAGATNARRITIDPVTRLEGHGRIEIFLDDKGEVDRAYFQVPEFRGFEKFVQGRPAEDMPQITSRICGVCPMAHHMAATKALDALYHVDPPPAARMARELAYCAFMVEDHALHFYFLGGPDFVVGPGAPASQRNILGAAAKLGASAARQVIGMRAHLREGVALIAGKAAHPVFGVPGGVAKRVTAEIQTRFRDLAREAVDFARFSLDLFDDIVLSNADYLATITSEAYTQRTYYMGLVDEQNRVEFYDGMLRVVGSDGHEWKRFVPRDYEYYIAEHVEPWTYAKFCYLKPLGWHGFDEQDGSSTYSVAPLARLNAATGMATTLADQEYKRFFATLGGKPVHHTLATHWARLIEMLYAAERMRQIAGDDDLLDPEIRRIPAEKPSRGVGVVEAPRGTLIHDYETDERGRITRANLIVATQNNALRIAGGIQKIAKHLIHKGMVDDSLLNQIEVALRAYDPCLGCATHAQPGTSLIVTIRDVHNRIVRTIE